MVKNDLLFDSPTLVDGGRSKATAVVNAAPKENIVNPPTVEDIKRIAKGENALGNLIEKIANNKPDVKLIYDDVNEVYKITDEDLAKLKKYPLIVFFAKGETGFTEAPPSSITLCKNVPDSNYFAISYINLVPNSVEGKFAVVVEIEFSCNNVLVPYELGQVGIEPLDTHLSKYYSLEFYGIE